MTRGSCSVAKRRLHKARRNLEKAQKRYRKASKRKMSVCGIGGSRRRRRKYYGKRTRGSYTPGFGGPALGYMETFRGERAPAPYEAIEDAPYPAYAGDTTEENEET